MRCKDNRIGWDNEQLFSTLQLKTYGNMQEVLAIYAVSENGVIGKEMDLPWHLPNDLRHFKALTLHRPIIMGRKSFASIGKPLPKRRNIVLTRQADFKAEGVEVVSSLEAAMELVKEEAVVCITGGAGVYKEAFEKNLVTKVHETLVHADVEGDVHFSLPNSEAWKIADFKAHQADAQHEFAYTFRTFIKK
ncbi:MAG: dihydrofolate reductase [Bacteroidota bacterium]